MDRLKHWNHHQHSCRDAREAFKKLATWASRCASPVWGLPRVVEMILESTTYIYIFEWSFTLLGCRKSSLFLCTENKRQCNGFDQTERDEEPPEHQLNKNIGNQQSLVKETGSLSISLGPSCTVFAPLMIWDHLGVSRLDNKFKI